MTPTSIVGGAAENSTHIRAVADKLPDGILAELSPAALTVLTQFSAVNFWRAGEDLNLRLLA